MYSLDCYCSGVDTGACHLGWAKQTITMEAMEVNGILNVSVTFIIYISITAVIVILFGL